MIPIEDFALGVFAESGAQRVDEGAGVFRIEGGDAAAAGLDGRYTFSRAAADAEGVQLLAPGSPSLQRLLGWAQGQGLIAYGRILPSGPKASLDLRKWALARFVRGATEMALRAPEQVSAFHFVVTMHGEVEEAQFQSVVVSLEDYAIHHRLAPILMDRVTEAGQAPACSEDALRKAFLVALAHVERSGQSMLTAFAFGMQRRLQVEQERLDTYFETLDRGLDANRNATLAKSSFTERELRDKIARSRSSRTEKRYRDELSVLRATTDATVQQIEDERRQLRVQHAERRAATIVRLLPRATVTLVGTLIVEVPVLGMNVQVVNRTRDRMVAVRVSQPAGDVLGVNCESCRDVSQATILDLGGHLICDHCAMCCEVCGDAACPQCAADKLTECYMCRGYVCANCAVVCAGCNREVCSKHAKRCVSCGARECGFCMEHCGVCSDVTCPRCATVCSACKEHVCAQHRIVCHLCGADVCSKHGNACACCGRGGCGADMRTCSDCGMQYCRACVGGSGRCGTCRNLGSPVPKAAMDLLAGRNVPFSGDWSWGKNRKYTILRRATGGGTRLWVFDSQGRLCRERSGGLLASLLRAVGESDRRERRGR